MSNDATYGLVEPFECDDPAFCYGVEWEMFRQQLAEGEPFTRTIHAANAERLSGMVERHGRFVEVRPCDEGFDEWAVIVVGGLKWS